MAKSAVLDGLGHVLDNAPSLSLPLSERPADTLSLDGDNDCLTQMNVRINRSLKRRGDKVLASIGMTPSQGIRAFYKLLSTCYDDPKSARIILELDDDASEGAATDERRRKMESFDECRKSIEGLLAEFGIKPGEGLSNDPNERAQQYKEMGREAAWEKYDKAARQ